MEVEWDALRKIAVHESVGVSAGKRGRCSFKWSGDCISQRCEKWTRAVTSEGDQGFARKWDVCSKTGHEKPT